MRFLPIEPKPLSRFVARASYRVSESNELLRQLAYTVKPIGPSVNAQPPSRGTKCDSIEFARLDDLCEHRVAEVRRPEAAARESEALDPLQPDARSRPAAC